MVLDLQNNKYNTGSESVCALNTQPFSHPVSLPQAVSPVDHAEHLLFPCSLLKKKPQKLQDTCHERLTYELVHLLAINNMSSTFFSFPGSNWTPSLK